MKTLKAVIILIVFALQAQAQNSTIVPFVDERTELLGVVFRLAGASEFTNNNIADYSTSIDEYFSVYKNHEAVKMAKMLRQSSGISYDAVMSLAVNIEIGNEVKLIDDITSASLDSRWIMADAKRFVRNLNDFYSTTDFKTFFNNHKPLYQAARNNFEYLLNNMDTSWFSNFFGAKNTDNFDVIIGLTHTGSFGQLMQQKTGNRKLYAIIGTYLTDSLGVPIYKPNMLGVIVHEFCHSFCNTLIDRHYDDMRQNAKSFFKLEQELLSNNAYGSDLIMLYETLVRSCVIQYYSQKNVEVDKIKQMIAQERNGGFLWIDSLVQQLNVYQQNRDKYATLNDFMPQIVQNFNSLKAAEIKKHIVQNSAKIVDCSIKNGSRNIAPQTDQIVITFSSPMNHNAFGLGTNPKGRGKLPRATSKKVFWDENNPAQLIIPIKLEPNTKYSMVFYAHYFMDENGFPLDKNYVISFKTDK